METRKCCVCGYPLLGRTDKKYCSDDCRYKENNKLKQVYEQPIIETNKILRRNRNLLRKHCPEGEAYVKKESLENQGFNTQFFSSMYLTARRRIYFICYDYAWSPVITNGIKKVFIVRIKGTMLLGDPWRFVPEWQTMSDGQ